ncbi:hypothetical protein ACFPOA_03340 [Lysobacter niabensis]|uniref:hypothetical protein n=1 Tax=Agrilutibacter niabensis TaxID=380628 RepID=UPI003616FC78
MRRIVVCLLIALTSATVAARESKLSDADGGSCPSQETRSVAARTRDPAPMAVPVKKTKASLPSNGGSVDEVRLQSPRWHRFLPGMFR